MALGDSAISHNSFRKTSYAVVANKIFPFIKEDMRRTIVTERRETALNDIDKRTADT